MYCSATKNSVPIAGFGAAAVVALTELKADARIAALRDHLEASLRQISLHVIPGSGSYGSALFGFHFYTLAFVAYGMLVVFTGLLLVLHVRPPLRERIVGDRSLETMACWLFMALAAANVAAFALECGLGACPDNPVGYLGGRSRQRTGEAQSSCAGRRSRFDARGGRRVTASGIVAVMQTIISVTNLAKTYASGFHAG